MIDSVALVWGRPPTSPDSRLVGDGPRSRDSPPIKLDWDDLRARLGDDDGQVRRIDYGDRERQYAHWPLDGYQLMYGQSGRVEIRSSLPKLLVGRNDVVLTERGVHAALRELVRRASRDVEHELRLEDASPTRLDYAYQWEVPSVAAVLEHLKATYPDKRRLRTENVSPKGGRSIVWGYKGRRLTRFYDKVGELLDHGDDPLVEIDVDGLRDLVIAGETFERRVDGLLRYEIQERRRTHLQLIHENGYAAADVHRELVAGVESLQAVRVVDLEALIDSYGSWPYGVAFALASYALKEHPDLWPILKRRVSRKGVSRWRDRARAASFSTWRPDISEAAFAPRGPLWPPREELAA